MQKLAIVPARGGSKGVPRKNAKYVAGKPLIGRAVDTLSKSQSVDRTFVSTDDPEIASIAREHSAEVIERPPELSGDEASSESALLHGLKVIREEEEYRPDILVFVQCTSPLLTTNDVDGAIETFLSEDADVVFSATDFHGFLWRPTDDGSVTGINHDASERKRRQDRETQYMETGGVYVLDREGFEDAKHRFFGRVVPYEVPQERSMEIDRPVDLTIAEELLRSHTSERKADQLPIPVEALVLDFDGVFTDNKVHVRQDRTEMVVCHRGDGWGLSELQDRGLPIWVLSTEKNSVVQARCDKLGLPCMHGAEDKKALLQNWLSERDIDPAHVVFLGNDVNDQECLRLVGCGAVVADAHPKVKPFANLMLTTNGGNGAVRELTDLILHHNRKSQE
nr:acylneuraminate cytidylyltransferase [Salinibacter ruber]